MAKFDERLPLTQGTNRVIEDPAGPSLLGAVADFATQAIGGYVNLRQAQAAENAKKKKAEKEARDNQIYADVSAAPERAIGAVATTREQFVQSLDPAQAPVEETGSLVNPDLQVSMDEITDSNGVFSVPKAQFSPALVKEVSVAAQRAANFKAASDQGRIPTITFNSAMNADFRRLRDKWGPDAVPVLIKAYKDMGLDANLFTEAKDAQDEHEFWREQGQEKIADARKREETYITSAEQALGTAAIGRSREELIVYGMGVTKDAFDLRMEGERYDVLNKRQDLADAQKKTLTEDIDQSLEQKLISGSFNASQPFIQSMGRIVDGLGTNPNDPQLIQRFQNMAPEAKLGVERYIAASKAAAVSLGYKGDLNKLEGTLRQQWQPILDLFTGDFSVVSTKMNALKSIETSMKIDTATALPLYTALSGAGFKLENIPAVMQGLETDKEMMTALSNELKGYRQDLLDDSGSARFRRIIGILRGEDSLQYAKPGQLARELPNLVNTTRNLAKEYIRRPQDIDGDLVINGIGEISTQIRTLGPSNGMDTFYVATRSFAGSDVRQALINTLSDNNVDKTMAVATVQASRAASAQMLNYYRVNLGNINKTSNLFKVVWDADDGKYKLDRSGQKSAVAAAKRNATVNRGDKFDRMAGSLAASNFANAPVPESMTRFIQGANVNLENAIELGKHDPTTPKATDVELRNWYGQEKPLKQPKSQEPIDPEKELRTMFDKAEQSLDQLREDVTSRRVAPGGLKQSIIEGEAGPAGYDSVYGDHANGNAHNLSTPKPVTQMTIGEAIDWGKSVAIPRTRGKVGAGADKGTSAIGAYQFTQGTLAEFGQKVFGDSWRDTVLSAANQDLLADAIIESTGMDKEALIGRWPSLKGKL